VEAQLKSRELREAKERESNGNGLNKVDLRVLLEEIQTVGDDDEVALLPKSREELEAELERRRNRNTESQEPS
jgi:molybdopterin converting factor small subunit